jgi:phosphoserine phosphatase RsbU/P
MHRMLQRQLKRSLGVAAPEELATLLDTASREAGRDSPQLTQVLEGLRSLIERVSATYEQHDRDLDLRTRSLDLSSAELIEANERLRADIAARNRATRSLKTALAELAGGEINGVDPTDATSENIESLSRLIQRLVAEREQQRRKLDNLKFALDEHSIVSMTDTSGAITYANDQFCKISGYTREELIGANHRMIRSPRQGPEFFEDLWKTICAGKVWHSEICNLSKSGDEYWVAATIVPLLDSEGRPQEFIAIRTDITRQKQTEERLALYQRHLETLIKQYQEAEVELAQARARELDIGSQIQRSLLLGDVPQSVGPMSIAAHTEPSLGIDGDFYEFFSYAPHLFDISIGDVMGKGVLAALIGAAVKQQTNQVIATMTTRAAGFGQLPEPAELMNALHRKLTPRLIDLKSFVTLAYLRFDLRLKQVTIVDAGHPHAIVVGEDGVRVLSGDNLPLGITEEETYRQFTTELHEGELFFLYSDGVTEARDSQGSEFGFERLSALLLELYEKQLPAEMVLQVVRKALREFEQRADLIDDRTCIAMKLDHADGPAGFNRIFSMPRRLDSLGILRKEVGDMAKLTGLDDQARDALTLAGFEAATNVIRHTPQALTDETLHCQLAGNEDALTLSIYYLGEPFTPIETSPDFSGNTEGGFGLYIIDNSVDEVAYGSPAPGVCRILLAKNATPPLNGS